MQLQDVFDHARKIDLLRHEGGIGPQKVGRYQTRLRSDNQNGRGREQALAVPRGKLPPRPTDGHPEVHRMAFGAVFQECHQRTFPFPPIKPRPVQGYLVEINRLAPTPAPA